MTFIIINNLNNSKFKNNKNLLNKINYLKKINQNKINFNKLYL